MTRFNRQKWGLSRLPDAMDEAVCRQLRVVIASTDQQIVSRIREAFAECTDVAGVVVASDSIEAAQLAASTQPDVVVMDQAFEGDGLHLCGVLNRIAPHTKIILLVSGVNEETVIGAARAGARDVLSQSFEPHEFVEAIGRLTDEAKQRVGQDYELAINPEVFPRVMIVTSCKGGTGTSSIAANMAQGFSASNTGKTLLFDCTPTFPAANTMFDASPRRGLADIVPHWEAPGDLGLDQDLVRQCVVTVSDSLDVLVAASPDLSTPPPAPGIITGAVRILKRLYRYIVVDTRASMMVGREPALPSFWRLLLVVNLDEVAVLHNTKRLLATFSESYALKERVGLIVNRYTKGSEFSLADLQSALELPVAATIPEDINLRRACNLGKPVVLENPRAPSAKALTQLTDGLIQTAKRVSAEGQFLSQMKVA